MQVYKSPSSTNKYALVASNAKKTASIGLNVQIQVKTVELRFCMFCKSKPDLLNFSYRSSHGVYTNIENNEDVLTGGQLDRVVISVKSDKKGPESVTSLKDGEVERLIDWITEQVNKEKMELVVPVEEIEALFLLNNNKDCSFALPATMKVEPKVFISAKPKADPDPFEDENEDETDN